MIFRKFVIVKAGVLVLALGHFFYFQGFIFLTEFKTYFLNFVTGFPIAKLAVNFTFKF